jgi:hypothetical protein
MNADSMAARWLQRQLSGGPVAVRQLQANAEHEGISWSALCAARAALRVEEPERHWRLPGSAPSAAASPTAGRAKELRIAALVERYRTEAILTAPQAAGRTALAHQLAFHSDEPAEAAIRALAEAAAGATEVPTTKATPGARGATGKAGGSPSALFERRRAQAGHSDGAPSAAGHRGTRTQATTPEQLFARRRKWAGHAA